VSEANTEQSLDPLRFQTAETTVNGVRLAYVREGAGGTPLLLVHGWPETKRIWWRVIAPLAAAGFEVIVPDLRGFGDSDISPDGFHDVAAHSRDLHALVHDHLGHDRIVAAGGDLGGPVIQDLSLRFPGFVERLVLFNSPLPYEREAMAGLRTRPPRAVIDYFIRQGTDPDGLMGDLPTPAERERYVATFYTSRLWAHPDTFTDEEVSFHTAPFADARHLRASFGAYEATFSESSRSEPPLLGLNPTHALLLYGPSDHVIPPDFDRVAAIVFPDHVGPFLLRDTGHFVPWEASAVFVSAVRAFCRDLL